MASLQSPSAYEVIPKSNAGLEVYQEAPIPVYQPHEQTAHPYYGAAWSPHDNPVTEKRLWGLPARIFWLLVFITLLVVIGAIGGGIGGWVSVQNSKHKACEAAAVSTPTPTSISGQGAIATPTPTTITSGSSTIVTTTTAIPTGPYTAVDPTIVATLVSPQDYTAPFKSPYDTSRYFKYYSATDIPGYDIAGNIAYSLEQCVQACLTLNSFGSSDPCRSVTFRTDLANSVAHFHGANCFLKGIAPQKAESADAAAKAYSARLCLNSSCAEYNTSDYDGNY